MREYIKAEEGYILTDGTNYGTVIYLADGIDKNIYYPIPLAEYEEILRQEAEADLLKIGGI